MRQSFLAELDYEREAKAAAQYAEAAKGIPELRVPRVDHSLTRRRVLTMERLMGPTLKELLHAETQLGAEERFEISRLLLRSFWGPFLKAGVTHCDPHPGNFIVLPGGQLGVLDFGSTRTVSDGWLQANRRLIQSALEGTAYDAIGESLACGFQFGDIEQARPFVEAVLEIATKPARVPFFDYGTAGINRSLRQLFLENARTVAACRPPKEAVLFFRAVTGFSQNLENLKSAGDFQQVFRSLL